MTETKGARGSKVTAPQDSKESPLDDNGIPKASVTPPAAKAGDDIAELFAKPPKPAANAPKPPPKVSLAGKYRVREGYHVAHGESLNSNGHHAHASPGEIIDLSHDEALSFILRTKDAKGPDGRPSGPCIENEDQYRARLAQAQAMKDLYAQIQDAEGAL